MSFRFIRLTRMILITRRVNQRVFALVEAMFRHRSFLFVVFFCWTAILLSFSEESFAYWLR